MNSQIEKIYITEERLKERVLKVAETLDERFKDASSPILAICVLKGAAMFFCDLVRAMKTPLQIDFITVSSYGQATVSCGQPKIINDTTIPVKGRDVLLVEDIIDSGNTILYLKNLFSERGAKSFTAVTLLDKPARRTVDVKADYSCFEVDDEFLVGYGLDYAQSFRNLPYVAVLKREVYGKQ